MFWVGLFVGLAVSAVIALPVGWILLRRSARRERLAERRAVESERLAEIGAMTGGLAHEIKNPLSTIGLNAQLVSEAVADLPIGEQERDRLTRRIDTLRREVDRLREILEDFLRFAGTVQLDPQPTDLNNVISELADFYLPQAQRQGVELRTELSREPVPAEVDASHFKQAVLNLMINAGQAMAETDDGNIRRLTLKTRAARKAGEPVAEVRVCDTGPGVPQEQLDRIFTPYYTTRRGGVGLGLAITKRLIEEHGGRVHVRSEPGEGAEFVITLPGRS